MAEMAVAADSAHSRVDVTHSHRSLQDDDGRHDGVDRDESIQWTVHCRPEYMSTLFQKRMIRQISDSKRARVRSYWKGIETSDEENNTGHTQVYMEHQGRQAVPG